MSDAIRKWWREYIQSDLLKREKLVAELPLLKTIILYLEEQGELGRAYARSMVVSVRGYFDDALTYGCEEKRKVQEVGKE